MKNEILKGEMIMKNFAKYICLFLAIVGINISAWAGDVNIINNLTGCTAAAGQQTTITSSQQSSNVELQYTINAGKTGEGATVSVALQYPGPGESTALGSFAYRWDRVSGKTYRLRLFASSINGGTYGGYKDRNVVITINCPSGNQVYTLTYDANGGETTCLSGEDHEVGENFTLCSTPPTRAGFTFGGWRYNSTNYAAGASFTMPDADATLVAQWSGNQYAITLNSNAGVSNGSANVRMGATAITDFARVTNPAATILGYYTAARGGRRVLDAEGVLQRNVPGYTTSSGEWIKAENTTLHAQYLYANYQTYCPRTLTFDKNGQSTATPWPADQTGKSGFTPTRPVTNPAVAGQTFGGWYTNQECTGVEFNFATVTEDMTLYAKWTPQSYTFTLDKNTGEADGSVTYTYGATTFQAFNAATKTGYYTVGYYQYAGSGSKVLNADGTIAGNVAGWTADGAWVQTDDTKKLYPHWTANTYYIEYNDNGKTGGAAMTRSTLRYNQAANLKANTFTKTGYTFAGWSTVQDGAVVYADGQSVNNLTTENGTTITLYAKWTPISYTVVYDGNGNTGGSMANTDFTYGESKALRTNAFTKPGSTFLGWSTVKDGPKVYDDKEVVSNLTATAGATITLYAKWELQFGTMTISGDVHLTTGNGIQVYTTTEANNLITLSCDNLGAANSFKIEYLDEGDQVIAKGSSLFRLCYAPGYEQGNSAYTVADGSNIPLSQAEKDAVSYSRKFAISYTPNAASVTNRWKLRLTAMTSGNAELASQTITLNGRSLPSEFVIATKINGEWYALRSDMSSSSENSTPLQGAKIEVNNTTTPTIATYAPQNARYTTAARNAPQSYRGAVRLQSVQTNGYLQATESDAANIWLPTTNNTKGMQDWYLRSTNFGVYNIDLYPRDNEGNLIAHGRALSVYDGNIGWYTTQANTFYLLPIDPETEFGPMLDIVDWSSSSVTVNMSNSTRTLTMGAVTKTKEQRETDRTMVLTSASTLNAGDLVLISGVNATSSALETKHKYKVPYICTGTTTISAKTGFDGSTTLYVKDGVTTVSAEIEIAKVIVCPGAALNVTGRIRCGELIIRTTPWESGSVDGNVVALNTFYTRIIAKQDAYYHFALPYASNVDEVFLSNHSNAPYGNTWILKSYNGARRANSGADGQNWTLLDGTSNKTIAATTGYEMFSNSGYYREFYFPVTPTANKSVSLVAHSGSAGEAHKGWNAVCSPIMSNYAPRFSLPSEALKISELVDLDVYWQHIPTQIVPAIPFYVQTETNKTLLFDNSYWNSPARVVEDNVAEQWLQLNYTPATGRGDETNIFVHPNFTAAYETGKDVAKQTLTGKYPVVYVSLACGNLAFAAVPDELAADRIPLTVYAPQTAEMTFSLADNTYLDRLESLYLVDEQDGAMIDLLTSDYTYSAEQGTTSGRFYLVAVFRAPQVPTDWQGADGGGNDVKKIIYRDHLYILRDGHIWDANGKRVK